MFLHEVSRKVSRSWSIRVDSEEYAKLVRERFSNQCPYCSVDLKNSSPIIEHLDGMNRLRAGLHVPGNVLVACRKCNNEKRRDDAIAELTLNGSGWESFLSHDGSRCLAGCRTCTYWKDVWPEDNQRAAMLSQNLERIRDFRRGIMEFEATVPPLMKTLPVQLAKLYSDCQTFAESEIKSLIAGLIVEP